VTIAVINNNNNNNKIWLW